MKVISKEPDSIPIVVPKHIPQVFPDKTITILTEYVINYDKINNFVPGANKIKGELF